MLRVMKIVICSAVVLAKIRLLNVRNIHAYQTRQRRPIEMFVSLMYVINRYSNCFVKRYRKT